MKFPNDFEYNSPQKDQNTKLPGCVVQSVTCLAADTCLTADPRSQARSRTFMEIGREIISRVILLPSADSGRVVFSYKRKYVHKVLVNYLSQACQEKRVVR